MSRRTPCVSQPQAENNSTPPQTIIDRNCQRVDGSLSEPYCVATSHATDGPGRRRGVSEGKQEQRMGKRGVTHSLICFISTERTSNN